MKRKKKARWPDYELVDLGDTITFGTSLFMRKDGRALRILFPAGQAVTFAPQDEIDAEKSNPPPPQAELAFPEVAKTERL